MQNHCHILCVTSLTWSHAHIDRGFCKRNEASLPFILGLLLKQGWSGICNRKASKCPINSWGLTAEIHVETREKLAYKHGYLFQNRKYDGRLGKCLLCGRPPLKAKVWALRVQIFSREKKCTDRIVGHGPRDSAPGQAQLCNARISQYCSLYWTHVRQFQLNYTRQAECIVCPRSTL